MAGCSSMANGLAVAGSSSISIENNLLRISVRARIAMRWWSESVWPEQTA